MKTYPSGTIRRLLETDLITLPTRGVLSKRLETFENYEPQFFDAALFAALRAVCARLISQPDRVNPIDCAAAIDRNLSQGKGNGWRYDALPDDGETFKRGLGGIDEMARAKFQKDFRRLNANQQDEILAAIQNGEAKHGTWETLSAELFFEELLASAMEIYYAHPLAQEEIGYVGMADAAGWKKIKIGELEAHEPRVIEPIQ